MHAFNVTKISHATTCNVLIILWYLAICTDCALLYLAKDAIGKELCKPQQVNLSTLFNPCQTGEF